MVKCMIFVKRRADMDRSAFHAWWREKQKPLTLQIPGLRGHTMSFEADGEDGMFDGVAELWFDSIAAAEAGFASPEGQASMAEAKAHLARRELLYLTEHKFVNTGKPSSFKLVSLLKRRKDLTRAQFKQWWLDRHAPLVVVFPELTRYQVDLVEEGPEGIADGIAEVSFATLEALKRITSSTQVKDAQQDSVVHTDWRFRMFVEEHPVL
jgi:uncharacterized protein (TIGR02118 family)